MSWRTHGGNGLKFCMLMYLDHLQNWWVLGYGLLTFVILALFWLSETGQIWGFRAFPGEHIKGNGQKYGMLLYPDHLQNWLDYGYSLVIFLILVLFKSPQYTGGDFMFLYRFVRRRRRRRPQILVHAITFEQLFGFLSFLAQLLALTCGLPD